MSTESQNRPTTDSQAIAFSPAIAALRAWDRTTIKALADVAAGVAFRYANRFGLVVEATSNETHRRHHGVEVEWDNGKRERMSGIVRVDIPVGGAPPRVQVVS